jgi:hypothetical protein
MGEEAMGNWIAAAQRFVVSAPVWFRTIALLIVLTVMGFFLVVVPSALFSGRGLEFYGIKVEPSLAVAKCVEVRQMLKEAGSIHQALVVETSNAIRTIWEKAADSASKKSDRASSPNAVTYAEEAYKDLKADAERQQAQLYVEHSKFRDTMDEFVQRCIGAENR